MQSANIARKSCDYVKPFSLLKGVGSTTYIVAVHFSETSSETLGDKLLRLFEREVSRNA
jgi:hypothetical protein